VEFLPPCRGIAVRVDDDAKGNDMRGLQLGAQRALGQDLVLALDELELDRRIVIGPRDAVLLDERGDRSQLVAPFDDQDVRVRARTDHRTSSPRAAACCSSASLNATASGRSRSMR
jgi:hypothetical protein